MNFQLNARRSKKLLLVGTLSLMALTAHATEILFVGNSFIYGGGFQPVSGYNKAGVTDLNGNGYSGVAGIFQTFTVEAGLSYNVSVELIGGSNLQQHYNGKRTQLGSKAWDTVVMQDHSTMNNQAAGNPTTFYQYSALVEQFIHGTAPVANPNANAEADVYLMQTWARPDQVYNTAGGVWNGTSLEKMTGDLHNAYYTAAANNSNIEGVIPVGDSWLLAVQSGVADRNPYDGIDPGKVDLWAADRYHGGAFGSYLEALVIFGQVTGQDPRSLGAAETAAAALGISPAQAQTLQGLAYQQLQISAVPEPESYAMLLAGLGIVGFVARRRARREVVAIAD